MRREEGGARLPRLVHSILHQEVEEVEALQYRDMHLVMYKHKVFKNKKRHKDESTYLTVTVKHVQ